MATYVMLKAHFQKLSKIDIFWKSKDFELNFSWIFNMCTWCYIWCCKQHSIIVAGFQQKCCFSAPNVDFSWLFILIHVKIGNQTKKQHLLLENNNFVENQQQWCFVAPSIIYSIRIIQKPISCFAHFFESYLEGFLGNLLKKMRKCFSLINSQGIRSKHESKKWAKHLIGFWVILML